MMDLAGGTTPTPTAPRGTLSSTKPSEVSADMDKEKEVIATPAKDILSGADTIQKEKKEDTEKEKGKEGDSEEKTSDDSKDEDDPPKKKKGSRRGFLELGSARTTPGDIEWYRERLALAEQKIKNLEERDLERKQKIRELKQQLKAAEGKGLLRSMKRVSHLWDGGAINFKTTPIKSPRGEKTRRRSNSFGDLNDVNEGTRPTAKTDVQRGSAITKKKDPPKKAMKTTGGTSILPQATSSPTLNRQESIRARDDPSRWTLARVAPSLHDDHDVGKASKDGNIAKNQLQRLRRTNLSLQDVKQHFKSTDDTVAVKTGENLLHLECEKARPAVEVIKYLLTKVDINHTDKSDWTALHCLCKASARYKPLKLLVKAGADVNATTTDGTTPLHYLVCRNPSDAKAIQQIGRAIDLLLLKGADINLANKHGETPIFHSVSYGNFDIMLILIAKGADLTRRTGLGASPLHYAIAAQKPHMVAKLIKLGISPREEGCSRGTAEHMAQKAKGPKAREILVLCQGGGEKEKRPALERTTSWKRRVLAGHGIPKRPLHSTKSFLSRVVDVSNDQERVHGERLHNVKKLVSEASVETHDELEKHRQQALSERRNTQWVMDLDKRLALYLFLTDEDEKENVAAPQQTQQPQQEEKLDGLADMLSKAELFISSHSANNKHNRRGLRIKHIDAISSDAELIKASTKETL